MVAFRHVSASLRPKWRVGTRHFGLTLRRPVESTSQMTCTTSTLQLIRGKGEAMGRRGKRERERGSGSRLKMEVVKVRGGKEGGSSYCFPFIKLISRGHGGLFSLWLLLDLLGECCRLPGCMLVSKGVLGEILSVCFSVLAPGNELHWKKGKGSKSSEFHHHSN